VNVSDPANYYLGLLVGRVEHDADDAKNAKLAVLGCFDEASMSVEVEPWAPN